MSTADSASQPTSPSHETLEAAAEWFAMLWSDEATAADQQRWQRWLDSAAENQLAWNYVERISGRFQTVQKSPERHTAITALSDAQGQLKRRRKVMFGIAGAVSGGLLGWGAWRYTALSDTVLAWSADYRTGTGEMREVALSDGTLVWLNAESAFNESYRSDERRLGLVCGEILIKTAADATRPFLVDTRHGQLQALGTRFTVRLEQDHTFVAVYEGAVEVRTRTSGASAIIHAGQQLRFTDRDIDSPGSTDPAREAWIRGVLIARNMPLGELVRELQRYHKGHLSVSPDAGALPVFGSYPLRDTERALEMLSSVMPIDIKKTLSWWTSISLQKVAGS